MGGGPGASETSALGGWPARSRPRARAAGRACAPRAGASARQEAPKGPPRAWQETLPQRGRVSRRPNPREVGELNQFSIALGGPPGDPPNLL